MMAYFCHHLSDNYVDLSDLNVDLFIFKKINLKNVYLPREMPYNKIILQVDIIADKST